jgi:hypothetical protein
VLCRLPTSQDTIENQKSRNTDHKSFTASIKNIGWRTYIIFAVFNTCWVPIIYFFYPETKGLQLEDVDRLFSKTDDLTTLVAEKDKPAMEVTVQGLSGSDA